MAFSRQDSSEADVLAQINAIREDLAALKTAIEAITSNIDADNGTIGTDYAANCDPPALVSADVGL